MNFNEKLKALRLAQKLTQEQTAEYLSISAQSVSKWERGLLSPDISLLPKLAVLYKTSIDAMFDMEFYWDEQHLSDFRRQVRELMAQNDKEGIFELYMTEIERSPDRFFFYAELMTHVLRQKMFDDRHVGRLIRLSDYADRHCADDDIRNEIHRVMLQVCYFSENPTYRARVKAYYNRLSMLRHSREIYAKYVSEGEEYEKQLKQNIVYTVDIAECAVRQMIKPEMPPQEKLYYYQKAAGLYEVLLDDKFGGLYDIPLLCNYATIVKLYALLGQKDKVDVYAQRLLAMLERFRDPIKQNETSPFIPCTFPKHFKSPFDNCVKLLEEILNASAFDDYKEPLEALLRELQEKAKI